MIYNRVLEKLKHNKKIKQKGGYIGIPYPFPRLSEYIPSIEKGHSIGILAGTGVGKSKFTRYVFLYHVYKFHVSTGYPVKVIYFPLEDNTDKVYINLICNYLYDQQGIIISPQEIKSQKGTLPDFVEEKIEEAKEYFRDLEKIVTFVDYLFTPKEIYQYSVKVAMQHGKKMKRVNAEGEDEFYYQPTDDTHIIVIVDNMSNLDTDPDDGCNTEREAMVKFAKEYARAKMCNKYNMTVVQDMQLAFDKERQQYTHSGMTIVSKLEPSLDGVGDAKTITRSMHLVIGLFNPSRYDLVHYPIPPKEDPEACYRIDLLGNRFRALKIIKSNDSDVGMRIGMNFNALAETFEELPLPKTPEIKAFYQSLIGLTKSSGKSFVSLENNTNLAPVTDELDDPDELPF